VRVPSSPHPCQGLLLYVLIIANLVGVTYLIVAGFYFINNKTVAGFLKTQSKNVTYCNVFTVTFGVYSAIFVSFCRLFFFPDLCEMNYAFFVSLSFSSGLGILPFICFISYCLKFT